MLLVMTNFELILLCILVKVPQILKVVKAGNTEGLSIMSFYSELLAYTITYCYNLEKGFPFRYFALCYV